MSTFFVLVMIVSLPTVQTYLDDWHDTLRNRTIPVRIFLPNMPQPHASHAPNGDNSPPTLFPVILLSHGLGGSRDGFGYLGEDWSKHGYVVLVMQHPGSDNTVSAERRSGETRLQALTRAVNAEEANHRVGDVRFILDELERRNQSDNPLNKKNKLTEKSTEKLTEKAEKSIEKPDKKIDKKLAGKIDLNRIGMGGHSFGSQTTLAAVGRLPYKPEPRIKAALVMSPNTPKGIDPIRIHQNIKTPLLHLTGTNDRSPINKDFDPTERRIPFDNITGTDQYLVIFKDGNHLLFSGHTRLFGLSAAEKKCQPLIAELTRRFFDAYLKEDIEAKTWLRGKGFAEQIHEVGTLEIKIGSEP
ncbi:MAG: hypothetical protein LBQ50_08205 [Planctomycetaceae bacterium]|jgi:predicted dienelactone hydrolase|nr:hypothetical protein [Planctomycetaceae bacterium]